VRLSTFPILLKIVVRTHEFIAHVLAAVMVYLYIFLSLSTGPPLKETAPTSVLVTSSTRLDLFRIAANLW
jgi:hypothetical protein